MSYVGWIERHRHSLLFVALALAAAGAYAALSLPVSLFPVISFPRIRIEVTAGSRPAKQMLIDVTEPLEEVARAVPSAVDVVSTTSRGAAEIFVDFPWGTDMSRALLLVDAAFAQKLPDLPQGTGYDVIQMSPTVLMPFVSYALTSSTVPSAVLRQMAQYQIAPLLTGIAGVRRVGVLGGQIPEVQVSIAAATLQAYGLALADLSSAIAATNTISAIGRLEDNDLLYLAVGNDAFTSVASVRDVAVHTGRNGVVRLGDIAKVEMGTVPQWLLVDDNGEPAVTFDIYQQDSADSIILAREVASRLDAFMKPQPRSIHLTKWYDQTELVHSSITAMEEAIVIGLVFAACVVFGFLRNWRATVVAMMVVPASVALTVLLLSLFGMSFNIMTLGGLAAAIGLLIDDVIVMIEHISHRVGKQGADAPPMAILAASREFLTPLFGSSLATVIIFAPLAALSGVTGAFFKFLSLTMASALVISFILTALTVPLLARSLIDFRRWRDPDAGEPSWLKRTHGRLLRRLFAKPFLILPGIAGIALIGYVAYLNIGTGFLPKMDEGGFVLDYFTAPGTSLTETDRELDQVETILKGDSNVSTFSRRTGAGLGGDLKEAYQGDFFVRLVDASRRPPIWDVMDEITAKITSGVPGINIDPHLLLDDMINDMVGRPQPIVVNLSAKDPSVLESMANAVAGAISKVPGVEPASVNNGVVPAGDALDITVDPAAAALKGMTPAEVQNEASAYLQGAVTTDYLGARQPVGVRLRLASSQGRILRGDLSKLPIRAPNGHVFPLGAVAQVKFIAGQPELTRDNLSQIVAVTAEIGGGHDLGSAVAGVKQALGVPGIIPPGVYYTIGGAYKQQQMAAAGTRKAFAAATVAEIILLMFLYEDFLLAVVMVLTSLFSTSAVFLGLWLTGVELNITAMMGMVMIMGIATEMSIFLVSEYRELEQRMARHEALYQAALNRLRPITMSALAMVLALLPLGAAIGGSGDQMLQPLAITIIAGALVQLPLVLVALPVAIWMTANRSLAGVILPDVP